MSTYPSQSGVGLTSPGTGLQLPRRLALAHLHDPTRGGRQVDPLRLHRGLRAQRRPGHADGVLLERAVGEAEGQAEGAARGYAADSRSSLPRSRRAHRFPVDGSGDGYAAKEGPDYASEGLEAERRCQGYAGGVWVVVSGLGIVSSEHRDVKDTRRYEFEVLCLYGLADRMTMMLHHLSTQHTGRST